MYQECCFVFCSAWKTNRSVLYTYQGFEMCYVCLCFALDSSHVQTLVLTDVPSPFGTPLVPLIIIIIIIIVIITVSMTIIVVVMCISFILGNKCRYINITVSWYHAIL